MAQTMITRNLTLLSFKSMDGNTWKVVINGWTPQKVTTEDDSESLKSKKD